MGGIYTLCINKENSQHSLSIRIIRYDPIEILQKIDEKENDENNQYEKIKCNFASKIYDELFRWAIKGSVEYYKINKVEGLYYQFNESYTK